MRTKYAVITVVILGLALLLSPAVMAQEASEKQEQASTSEAEKVEKIDLNSASQKELETLPGIGPACAKAIIAARPYDKIEDVMRAKGIAEGRFAKIKDLVTVAPVEQEGEGKKQATAQAEQQEEEQKQETKEEKKEEQKESKKEEKSK